MKGMGAFIVLMWLFVHTPVKAEVLFFDYVWESPAQQQLFAEITAELRCVVCQGQSVSDSYAPLALEMKNQIYRQIKAHKTKTEIVDYFILRYGDSVHYHPSFSWKTAGLWIFPGLVLLLMIGRLRRYL